MTQKNPMQISARMDEIDAVLETEGVPSYSEMWAANAELREALECLRERLAMANATLSTLHGDLLLTAVDSRTNPASTAGTAQHDLDLVSG